MKTCARCGKRTGWMSQGRCAPCDAVVAYSQIVDAHGGVHQTSEQLIERLQQSGWFLTQHQDGDP